MSVQTLSPSKSAIPNEALVELRGQAVKIQKQNAKERIRKPQIASNLIPIPRNFDLTSGALLISDIMDPDYQNDCFNIAVLQHALFTLALSPTGNALIDDAAKERWRLKLDDLQGMEFSLDTENKTLSLDHEGLNGETLLTSEYFSNVVLIALVKGLRDIWHEKRQGAFENLFGPENILTLERVRSADCDVLSILCAWELRSEGLSHVWRFMIGSDMGDVAMVYSTYLERNPPSHFDRNALLAAFNQWFECVDRLNTCDHMTLNYIDDILMEEGAEAFGDKVPTHICVELLSCLPDKTAYLQGMGQTILQDAQYAGLYDDVNQVHFYHIMRDMRATIVENVAFRDAELAAKIFPAHVETSESPESELL